MAVSHILQVPSLPNRLISVGFTHPPIRRVRPALRLKICAVRLSLHLLRAIQPLVMLQMAGAGGDA